MLSTKWLSLLLLLLLMSSKSMTTPAQAATFTVTTTADDNDAGNADSTTSLREAILQANADSNPAVDTINFAIPGSGRQTINLTAELPEITHAVFINGYSQAGASQNTLATGDNAVLMVELNGSNVGTNTVSDPGGLVVNAPNCTIKGLVINRFPDSGIVLRTSGNLVAGNFIGTNGTGTVVDADNDISNGNSFGNAWGVEILAANNVLGGTTPAARNLISGNNYGGITIYADVAGGVVTGNLVQGNYIGTDVTGTLARGNAGEGVNIDGDGAIVSSNLIGGTTLAARNLISSNLYNGVRIIFDGATNNTVQGNIIGADITGSTALGNSSDGVFISSAGSNLVGGTASGAGNIIAFNRVDGVSVVAPQNNDGTLVSLPGNTINGNSIFANGSGILSLGIDLDDDGVTPNDTGDGDIGANDHQNFPVITSATTNGFITGTLNSTPNNNFRIEFFANTAADAAGYGEGEVFLGAQNVATDGAGNASFSTTVTLPTGKPYISATATKLATGDTSEFAACVQLTAPTNKPPVNSVPGAQSVNQDTALVFSSNTNNLIAISDPDAGQNAVRVILSATNGSITLSSTTGLTIVSGSNGSSTVTFTGTLSNINAALNGLSFVPTARFTGAASLTITTNDLGNSGTGGPQVVTSIVPITVNPLTRTFSVNSVTVPEGDSGTTNAVFPITLSAASTQPLTVQFATADGTAKAGSDYQSVNVTVGFSPGTTSRTIAVPIIGDTLNEGNETFNVLLSNPSGGASISNGSGTGVILDDDPLPALSINDVRVLEGNSGVTNAIFTISLSAASGRTITVNYATANGTALSGSDLTATTGTLTLPAGQTSATIPVPVLGDTVVEPDETFTLNLSNATNVTIARSAGVGTIVNDDTAGPPPPPIPTPVPIPVPTPVPTPVPIPTINVTLKTPANGAFIKGLTTITGTVGGESSLTVSVRLKRLSDARYWSGHSWSQAVLSVPAVVSNGSWALPLALLPRGAFLRDDRYALAVTATDNAGHSAQVSSTFWLDRLAPTLSILTPVNNATLSTLPYIAGRALDALKGSGVNRVILQLLRVKDGRYWTGTTWSSKSTALITSLSGAVWSRRSSLPTGANLQAGAYRLIAVAYDRANNRASATTSFTLARSLVSPIVLSSANAQAVTGLVQLQFTGALDVVLAGDAGHYLVKVNGVAVVIQSVGYNATAHQVTLDLAGGAVHARDKVTVQWTNLKDAQSRPVESQTITVTVG